MPTIERIKWLALKSLDELEKEIALWPSYILRVKSECGEITETARFTKEEKKQNKIYCYTHKQYEEITGAGKIKISDSSVQKDGEN